MKKPILAGLALLLVLATFVVFVAPLCFTSGCKPGQFASDVSIVQSGMSSAEGCIVQQIALGELTDPLEIVAACGPITVADVYAVTSKLLAPELDAGVAPAPAALAADAAPPAPALKRLRALHAKCRALLSDAGALAAPGDASAG
jgi:hypothetical protein